MTNPEVAIQTVYAVRQDMRGATEPNWYLKRDGGATQELEEAARFDQKNAEHDARARGGMWQAVRLAEPPYRLRAQACEDAALILEILKAAPGAPEEAPPVRRGATQQVG